ncbi:MAG: hypothetical protein ACLRMI_01355 [Streptococcus sp.]
MRSVEKIIKEPGNELVIVSGLAMGLMRQRIMPAFAMVKDHRSHRTGLDVFIRKAIKITDSQWRTPFVLSEYGPGQAPFGLHFPREIASL